MEDVTHGEEAFALVCNGEQLPVILHPGSAQATRGVLIIVGGPQYRVGSHRQFVLLARELSARGIPVLRFDCRGMGDAAGNPAHFTAIDADIGAAIDAFVARRPDLREIVLWGLCDAASAALFYGWRDRRVVGMVLLNPWVRTNAGQARAHLRHYYLRRLLSGVFWRKLVEGRLEWTASFRAFAENLQRARSQETGRAKKHDFETLPLPDRMAEGLMRFNGKALFILSGEDLTAAEFRDTITDSLQWQKLMQDPSITREDLPDADHTFSRRCWRDEVAQRTCRWVESI